jgi:hypothetical protein
MKLRLSNQELSVFISNACHDSNAATDGAVPNFQSGPAGTTFAEKAEFERTTHGPQIGCETLRRKGRLAGGPVQSLSTLVKK